MATILSESFETDGNGTRYTTSVPEFSDGSGDFFTRTDGSTIGSFYNVSAPDGSNYFAIMDTNGDGNPTTVSMEFTGISIAGFSGLTFSGLFAEDDDGSNQDWDADSLVYVEASIDGGSYTKILQFASQGATNTEPGLDADFDGVADSATSDLLTDTFASFSAAISGTGSTLDLRITAENLESGDEDIAFDLIEVSADLPFEETFDNNAGFTTSEPFFSDGSGDYFGISDGASGGDFGAGSTPSGLKSYTGAEGSFLTGMDLDGEGATLPITATWTGIDISGLTSIEFSGDFAEFFDDPGDIDAPDSLSVEAQIDGGGYETILSFVGANFSSNTFNGVLQLDSDLDGAGDGAVLGDAFQTFTTQIAGTGSTLDLRLVASLNAGDEDFAVDNFLIQQSTAPAAGITVSGTPAISEDGTTDTISVALDTTPTAAVDITVTADAQSEVSLDGVTFAPSVVLSLSDTTASDITVRAIDDTVDEGAHTSAIAFSVFSTDTDYDGLSVAGITADIADNDQGVTPIHDIQGNAASQQVNGNYDDASPLLGNTVTIEAIVVGDFQGGAAGTHGDFNGFYLQEEDSDADADASTSEGIFVFDGSSPAIDVQVGDLVRVSGTVDEFFGETQIDTVTSVSVVSSGNTLPTAGTITFPAADFKVNSDGEKIADLEAFEGMLVNIPNSAGLQVSDLFTFGRFGEIGLTAGGRNQTFTQTNTPDVAGFTAFKEEAVKNTIYLDDGSTFQNPASIPYPDGNFDGDEGLRAGDGVSDVTGVLRFSKGSGGSGDEMYRINPTDSAPTFSNDNPREATPDNVGGSLKVASLNVLNYFATIDTSGASTANGSDPRGADSAAELARQTDKLVTAITAIDADILGLMEIENDFLAGSSGNAVEGLVAALNSAVGAGTYAWVDPGQQFADNGDAISQAFIYKSATVGLTAGTTVEILNDADLPSLGLNYGHELFDGPGTNRAALAVTFEELASGEDVTIAVNHFKSKGSVSPFGNNAGTGDGTGNNNEARTQAAEALDTWLATDPTGSGDPDYLIIGDLNAYAMEDPITYLLSQGYTNLAQAFLQPGEIDYSFAFPLDLSDASQAQAFGTLDYGLANAPLLSQVTGATEWHINADEAVFFDYNQEFKTLDPFNASDPFRASDHDPLIIGLSLSTTTGPGSMISGTPNADTIVGTAGADTIDGLDGADSLSGFSGADSLLGGAGDDTLSGGTEADTLLGDAGDDQLFGGSEDDLVSGGLGQDIIGGEAGNDVLSGGDANDTIDGGTGDDSIDGDAGDDRISGGDGADTINGGTGADIVFASGGNDLVSGGDGNDSLVGQDGDDTLLGEIGNDTLTGFGGADSLLGDAGIDRLSGGDDNDTLDGGADGDSVYGGNGNDLILGGGGNDLLIGQNGADTISGQDGDDTVSGFAGNDSITGGIGDDNLSGGANDDIVLGETGNDSLFGGTGNDDLSGGIGDDSLVGGLGMDTLTGGADNDTLDGGDGADELFGEDGDDRISGGAGNDTIDTGAGNDTVFGSDGNDDISGLLGNDLLIGQNGNDTINGGAGMDDLKGFADNDVLNGGADADTVSGGAGQDVLIVNAGEGGDSLFGGADADTFDFASGFATATIGDFEAGLDTVDLADVTTATTFADLTITYNPSGTTATVDTGGADVITINGLTTNLIAADFSF